MLRREGIYSSHLATLRKQRQAAATSQQLEHKRGPKVDATTAQERKVRDLEAEVARLRDKLAKADLIINVQKTFDPAGTEHHRHAERAEVISAADNLVGEVGVAAACRALRLPRSALYRHRTAQRVCPLPPAVPAVPTRRPPLALSEHERRVVLDVLDSPRFANCAPAAIQAQLLDEGRYLASVRTMYRLLQGCADQPGFPSRFGSLADARAECAAFFTWYNQQHRHSGIGMMTPESLHTGRAAEVRKLRQTTLESAYQRTPSRFKNRVPQQAKLPTAAWINPPATEKKVA